MQKHKQEDKCAEDKFQCEDCEKCFKEERKLDEHVNRVHKKYECDECDKVFNFDTVLEKHIEAVHEDSKLFCHYFNNDKDCPYNDQCIFLHEESATCKFGTGCERVLCMFKHEESKEDEESEDDEESDDDDDIDADVDEESESVHGLKPILEKFKEAV